MGDSNDQTPTPLAPVADGGGGLKVRRSWSKRMPVTDTITLEGRNSKKENEDVHYDYDRLPRQMNIYAMYEQHLVTGRMNVYTTSNTWLQE